MRKYLIIGLAAAATVSMSGVAAADDIQSIDAAISPTKLDKKKKKNVTLIIDIVTQNNTGAATSSDQPPSANRTVVDFPKNLSFDTKAVDNCKVPSSSLGNTTTAAATDACGKGSIVSVAGPITGPVTEKGTGALVKIDPNPALPGSTPLEVPVVVTAFNGNAPGTLYLHSRADSVNNTTILVGTLGKSGGSYGNKLDVSIPPLLAGAIAQFKTTVSAGKYIQGVCKSKTNPFQATTTFSNFSSPTVSDTTETACTQKKKKKKKK